MNLQELKDKLTVNQIPISLYSLDEGLKPNAYILFNNYSNWEFFFLDEKGNRKNFVEFENSADAFDFFWKNIEREIQYPPTTPPF